MNTPTKAQIAAILGAIALLVLLLFARKTGPPASSTISASSDSSHASFSINTYIDSIKSTLDKNSLEMINQQSLLSNSKAALDSLSRIWKRLNQIGIQAYYLKELAKMENTADSWDRSGETYYRASRFAKGHAQHYFTDNAIEAFQKALQLDSTRLNTKVNLGICYVESTQEPMKGIMLLREVVGKDSTNISAQLNLGLFAVQSGQLDKAIERFKRIIRINPEYAEAYLYLGQTYANMGNKTEAISALEKFKELSNDDLIDSEVTQYINQLKNS